MEQNHIMKTLITIVTLTAAMGLFQGGSLRAEDPEDVSTPFKKQEAAEKVQIKVQAKALDQQLGRARQEIERSRQEIAGVEQRLAQNQAVGEWSTSPKPSPGFRDRL